MVQKPIENYLCMPKQSYMNHVVSNESSKCMLKDKYNKSWYIQQLLDQRFAKYYTVSDIRMLYQMCTLLYTATSWTDLTI